VPVPRKILSRIDLCRAVDVSKEEHLRRWRPASVDKRGTQQELGILVEVMSEVFRFEDGKDDLDEESEFAAGTIKAYEGQMEKDTNLQTTTENMLTHSHENGVATW